MSRTLNPNDINYSMMEKEVLALLGFLDVCYVMLVSQENKVLTQYSIVAWPV